MTIPFRNRLSELDEARASIEAFEKTSPQYSLTPDEPANMGISRGTYLLLGFAMLSWVLIAFFWVQKSDASFELSFSSILDTLSVSRTTLIGVAVFIILAVYYFRPTRKVSHEDANAARRAYHDRFKFWRHIGLPWYLSLPWWVYLAFAVYMTHSTYEQYIDDLAAQTLNQSLVQQAAPAPVDLGKFDRNRDIHAGNEVHVTGWIHPKFSRRINEVKSEDEASGLYMWVLFGQTDGEDAREVRAIVFLNEKQKEQFTATLRFTGETAASGAPLITLNGTKTGLGTDLLDIIGAFSRNGMWKADNFIVIQPFLNGRSHDLANAINPERRAYGRLQGICLLLILAGLRFFYGRVQRRRLLQVAA